MEENSEYEHFVWDEFCQCITTIGANEAEAEKMKILKKRKKVHDKTAIYYPHAYLILNFLDYLGPSQTIDFRKNYYRKVQTNEPDIIILQDIKDLVLYSLITPASLQFINFFHLKSIDHLLRALIIFFQFYIQVWEEEIIKRKNAMARKAKNPFGDDVGLKKAEEMKVLRFILSRSYCLLLLGANETARFHHSMAGIDAEMTISQGEKDLRIFETFLQVAHRIIWIALSRKHFQLIAVELDRLFRTDVYNIAERNTGYTVNQGITEDERFILHGAKMSLKRKLLLNSPLIYELLNESCDYELLRIALPGFKSDDPTIMNLRNALLADEDKFQELKIKVGILGESRTNYDINLVHINSEKAFDIYDSSEMDPVSERQKRSATERTKQNINEEKKFPEIPKPKNDAKLPDIFSYFSTKKMSPESRKIYDNYRKDSRRKWISRELNRKNDDGNMAHLYYDVTSTVTNAENPY